MLRRIDEGLPGARRWLGMYREMLLDHRYRAAFNASPPHSKKKQSLFLIFAAIDKNEKARRGYDLRKVVGGRSPEPSADLRRAGQVPRARAGEGGGGEAEGLEGEEGQEVLLPDDH